YNDTFLYHDPPHESPHRTIELNRTVASIVGQLRSGMPPAVGALAWISLSPPATTPYLPFHAGITGVASSVQTGVAYNGLDDFAPDSAWWSFRILRPQNDLDWRRYYPIVGDFWSALERRLLLQGPAVEEAALVLWEQGQQEKARQLLTDFSAAVSEEARAEAHRLRRWLEAVGADPF